MEIAKHAAVPPFPLSKYAQYIFRVGKFDVLCIREDFIKDDYKIDGWSINPLPVFVAKDMNIRDTFYVIGNPMLDGCCNIDHDHTLGKEYCKIPILCDSSALQPLNDDGCYDETEDDSAGEEDMEIYHCSNSVCPGVISRKCAVELNLFDDDNDSQSIDMKKWKCPLCMVVDFQSLLGDYYPIVKDSQDGKEEANHNDNLDATDNHDGSVISETEDENEKTYVR